MSDFLASSNPECFAQPKLMLKIFANSAETRLHNLQTAIVWN